MTTIHALFLAGPKFCVLPTATRFKWQRPTVDAIHESSFTTNWTTYTQKQPLLEDFPSSLEAPGKFQHARHLCCSRRASSVFSVRRVETAPSNIRNRDELHPVNSNHQTLQLPRQPVTTHGPVEQEPTASKHRYQQDVLNNYSSTNHR